MALVPLALLSAAWTTQLAGAVGSQDQLPGAARVERPVAADLGPIPFVEVPAIAVEVPASISVQDDEPVATDGPFSPVVSASTADIPAAALAAYQRAETVINSADTSCRLNWQLIAAVGRVESDHGRFGGSSIGADGVVSPAILGPVLDGRSGTSRISDTDAGQYDGDSTFDRAVGPLQFIPSTWAVVGVDADGDGVRNPQDIDDAALAAAVYLCSGDEDLATVDGERSAVYRYNHSNSYVDLVLSIMNSYLDGDFASVPAPTVSAGALVPLQPLLPVTYDPDPTNDEVAAVRDGATRLDLEVDHAQVLHLTPPVVTDPPVVDPPVVDPPVVDPPVVDPPVVDPPVGDGGDSPLDPPADDPSVPPTVPPTGPPTGGPIPTVPTGDPTDGPVGPGVISEATVPPSDEAVLACAVAGYLDDLLVTDDDYDLCVIAYDAAVAAGEDPIAAVLGLDLGLPTDPASPEASHG